MHDCGKAKLIRIVKPAGSAPAADLIIQPLAKLVA